MKFGILNNLRMTHGKPRVFLCLNRRGNMLNDEIYLGLCIHQVFFFLLVLGENLFASNEFNMLNLRS